MYFFMTLISCGSKSKLCDIHAIFAEFYDRVSNYFSYGPLDAINAFETFFDRSISKIFSSDWSIKCYEAFVALSGLSRIKNNFIVIEMNCALQSFVIFNHLSRACFIISFSLP